MMKALKILLTLTMVVPSIISFPISKPKCIDSCGNVSIPFPFGTSKECSHSEDFLVTCNTTHFNPPKLFLQYSTINITHISLDGQLRIMNFIAHHCYKPSGESLSYNNPSLRLSTSLTVNNTANMFTIVGCDTYAVVSGWRLQGGGAYKTGCIANCYREDDMEPGSCSGSGCCQTSIPKQVWQVGVDLYSFDNYRNVSGFDTCGYAFVVEETAFTFSPQNITNLRNVEKLPMVLDWAIGNETSCAAAKTNLSSYACKSFNSHCEKPSNGYGYRCYCDNGYTGNPYLQDGCGDIDECKDAKLNTCKELEYCVNRNGSFDCACPKGYIGDGRRDCNPIQSKSGSKLESLVFIIVAGISLGMIVLMLSACWFYFILQNRRLFKMRQHYFHQNGGMLLQQKLHGRRDRSQDVAKIYTEFELKRATKNFHSSMIIGEGGYGTVYKGFLPGDCVVAIKKAKEVPKQIDQFTNEVLVLSQIKHKNVVKLLGCCLETEFPLLVYEFISNGTLSQHVHNKARARLLSWETRLRIATEIATVLSYLHSEAASTPIIHRDVKCANILLDHSFTAKVADFGASRLVPLDPSQLSTMVQGTLGYLDPEYMQTNQLNEKSDVYSFGVVLVELLTGMTALNYNRPEKEMNLANLFLMKQDCLFQILEDNVVREGHEETLIQVCVLARRCLQVRGEDRPSMKELAMELEGIRVGGEHSWIRTAYVEEDKESLLGKGFDGFINGGGNSSSVGLDSLRDHTLLPLEGGR